MRNFELDLACYFQEGILVGEKENFEEFTKRAHRLKTLSEVDFKNPIFGIKKAHAIVEQKKPLLPWFAAITKFLYEDEIVIPKIEISVLAPNETLDHELIHAVKAPHSDSIFEEFLAYEVSSGLRRALGPLFFDPWEANILAITLLLGFFSPFLYLAALFLTIFFFIRLFWAKTLYKNGLLEIAKLFNAKNPLPYALLFTQKEWRLLAKREGQKVLNALKTQDPLRYNQLLSLEKLHL